VYLPHQGRFTSKDPNAAGTPVLASVAYHGLTAALSPNALDALGHYADGSNLYQYLGSRPEGRTDAAGLFFSMGDMGAAQTIRMDLTDDYVSETGGIFAQLSEMLVSAGFNQALDANWADDWAESDDSYSGAAQITSGGGRGGEEGDPWDQMAGRRDRLGAWAKGKGKGDARGMGVYIVIDTTTEQIVYAGRSRDLQRRIKQHEGGRYAPPGYRVVGIQVGAWGGKDAAYMATRALEDRLIRGLDLVRSGHNKIHGMNRTNGAKVREYYGHLRAMMQTLQ
jgi:hypothetical protein